MSQCDAAVDDMGKAEVPAPAPEPAPAKAEAESTAAPPAEEPQPYPDNFQPAPPSEGAGAEVEAAAAPAAGPSGARVELLAKRSVEANGRLDGLPTKRARLSRAKLGAKEEGQFHAGDAD